MRTNYNHDEFNEVYQIATDLVNRYWHTKGWYLSEMDKDDLLQEVLAKAWRCRDSYNAERGPLRWWLSRIVENVAKDFYSAYAKRREHFSPLEIVREDDNGDEERFFVVEPQAEWSRSDAAVETEESMSYIDSRISRLNKVQEQAMRMKIEGLKPAEIAEALGNSSSEVSSILFRGRQNLRKELGKGFLNDCGYAA